MEARIRARFADWKPAGPAQPATDLGSVRLRGLTAKVVEEPGAATRVQIGFARPFDAAPDSFAARRRDVIESFGPLVLNRRLARLAREPNPPFLRASVALQDAVKSAQITVLTAETSADRWQNGLEAIVAEQRRLLRFGVTQEELDREIVERRAGFQSGTSGAATRRTVDLAAALVGAVDGDKVFNTPAADQALFESIVKDLKADTVNKTLGSVFGGAGPLVQLVTPKGPMAVKRPCASPSRRPMRFPSARRRPRWLCPGPIRHSAHRAPWRNARRSSISAWSPSASPTMCA